MSERDKKKKQSASAKAMADKVYAHVRVDGLGASVEARERGRSGPPTILLDESGQRVASASPAARRCGVRPGTSLWEAQRRCPEVLVAEPDPEKYTARPAAG